MKAKILVKQSATPVFNIHVTFLVLEQVNKEFDERLGIIEKTDHSDWAAPTIYVKKKNSKLRVCADFSAGLNDCLISYNYPLLSLEEVFTKLNRDGWGDFLKIRPFGCIFTNPSSRRMLTLICY